jgi:Kef-type K+ transport system membrane component KefB
MTCLATGACLVCSSYALSERVPGVGAVPIVTGLSLAVSFLLPRRVRESWGDAPQLISGLCMQLFFATIGATTDVRALLSSGTLLPLFVFIGIILAVGTPCFLLHCIATFTSSPS